MNGVKSKRMPATSGKSGRVVRKRSDRPRKTAGRVRARAEAAVPEIDWKRAFVTMVQEAFPELTRHLKELVDGDITTRGVLAPRTNELLVVGVLAASGRDQEILKERVTAALRSGCSPAEVVEAIIQAGVSGAYERAIEALKTAKATFDLAVQRILIQKQEECPDSEDWGKRQFWYHSALLAAIQEAGVTGLSPKEIAERFGLRREMIYSWFSRTRAKDRRLARTPGGRYFYRLEPVKR